MLRLGRVHEIRRVKNMLGKINRVVAEHCPNHQGLFNTQPVINDLAKTERELTLAEIRLATPEEILANAGRLANLTRLR